VSHVLLVEVTGLVILAIEAKLLTLQGLNEINFVSAYVCLC
jgi:hypothetical protein